MQWIRVLCVGVMVGMGALEASRGISVLREGIESCMLRVGMPRVRVPEGALGFGTFSRASSLGYPPRFVTRSVSDFGWVRGMHTKARRPIDDDVDASVSQTLKPFLKHPQVYGIATYDALFKYVLSHTSVRPSFFHAFIPDLPIVSSERLDEHMNPLQGFQFLREFLHRQETRKTVARLSEALNVQVMAKDGDERSLLEDVDTAAFLREMVGRFEEMRQAFPKARYEGTMDFVCRLATGDYALVEMQVVPQDYWDQRALAYVAAFYGNQLMRGERWHHIRKVIGINILGGSGHWADTPDQYVRHYKVQEQLHKPSRFIDGIELIQYSLGNAPKVLDNQEQQDWITFFGKGAYMSEEEVKATIKTPAVLEAFELAQLTKIPPEVRDGYDKEVTRYDSYSQYTHKLVTKGEEKARKEGKAEGIVEGMEKGSTEATLKIAKLSIEQGLNDGTVATITGLTLDQIKAIRDTVNASKF